MATRTYVVETETDRHEVKADAFGISQDGVLEFREEAEEGGWSTVAAYGAGRWTRVYRQDVSKPT